MSETKSTRQVIGASRRRYARPRAQVEKNILYQLGHAPPPRKNRRKLRRGKHPTLP